MPALTKAQKKLAQAAEDSFNRTYAAQFGEERWQQSLYPALTAPTRYAALTNRFAGADLEKVFSPEQAAKMQAVIFPGTAEPDDPAAPLKAYQWDASEADATFPPPQSDPASGLMTHWNLDAASLLAVKILAPQPGDKVLDLCAAPGGKSVALAQLLRPPPPADSNAAAPSLDGGCLHSNEVNPARHKRLAANLASYLPASLFASGDVKVLRLDGADPSAAARALPLGLGGYDKVLLDAPCSSERHVVHARETGAWRSGRAGKGAKVQAALLMTALRAVRVGGRVLYATCALGREENDGVVERGVGVVVKERRKGGARWDLAVRSGELAVEGWAERTRFGWLVLPDHPSGGKWGPLFFALLEKVEA
ncbi:S-adenosyl-L-methionine-dependent methyltransferase [Nemania diffusa]|nr:S-adenosyl-L-methionine-dependent methyltransferase [Nemania diffusa]